MHDEKEQTDCLRLLSGDFIRDQGSFGASILLRIDRGFENDKGGCVSRDVTAKVHDLLCPTIEAAGAADEPWSKLVILRPYREYMQPIHKGH